MKKSLMYITATIIFISAIFLGISNGNTPVQTASAYEVEPYEFPLSEEVLLSHKFIGLEQTPYRLIEFTKLENGNIQISISFDPAFSDLLVQEYVSMGIQIPNPEIMTYELNDWYNESETIFNMLNDEGLWFVFEASDDGFIYDQEGYGYMIVQD